uniref:PWI domain-containing protein n=1 Tax=Zea mays TaxID=4577 RepID=A0A804R8Q4_MAIZE
MPTLVTRAPSTPPPFPPSEAAAASASAKMSGGLFREADGKKIQIQLTGFMEKNTMKFMKELWSLLLSAQQNASGVPQQFLDEKEAEIHKKKDDRIAQEIQKKPEKEGMDSELEKNKTMYKFQYRGRKGQ